MRRKLAAQRPRWFHPCAQDILAPVHAILTCDLTPSVSPSHIARREGELKGLLGGHLPDPPAELRPAPLLVRASSYSVVLSVKSGRQRKRRETPACAHRSLGNPLHSPRGARLHTRYTERLHSSGAGRNGVAGHKMCILPAVREQERLACALDRWYSEGAADR